MKVTRGSKWASATHTIVRNSHWFLCSGECRNCLVQLISCLKSRGPESITTADGDTRAQQPGKLWGTRMEHRNRLQRIMAAKLQISSREKLAVRAKDWYLNLWICVRNLLANKTRSVKEKGTEPRKKRKARERLLGGRGLSENVKETWRKSAEEKRLLTVKPVEPNLVSPLESDRSLPKLPQVLRGSATKKRRGMLLSAKQVQCTLISVSSWDSTTCGGCPQALAALHKAENSQGALRLWFQHREAPWLFFNANVLRTFRRV